MELKNKKILFVTTTDCMIYDFYVPHIKYFENEGATIICACTNTSFKFDELKTQYNINVLDMGFTRTPFSLKNLKAKKKLFKFVKNNHFDLIFCTQPVGGVMGRLVAHHFHIPVIYNVNGFHFYKGCPLVNKLLYKPIEKFLAKFTDCIVCVNEEDYQYALKMGIKKVYKINGVGIDTNKFSNNNIKDQYTSRKELGIDESDFLILSVGELNENKNTLRVIDAIKNIKNKNIKCFMCGNGPLERKYIDKINTLKLSKQVKLLGYQKDIPKLLNIADAFILPSYREGLSNAMMEAMSMGLPIIYSKIRGNIDLMGDDEGGIGIDPQNTFDIKKAIEKLYNDRSLCITFGNRNAEFVKLYDISVVTNQIDLIIKSI